MSDLATMADRVPAECFHLGEFIRDEMEARGWTANDVAERMGGEDVRVNHMCVMMLLELRDPDLVLGDVLPHKLARAFGGDPEYFTAIDRAWREWIKRCKT